MARIAVVDDDPEWAQLLLRVLKGGGYEVSHFGTPGRFFDSLLKAKPDLVLLDMQLPGMHGREVIRVLRANDATRGLLVVAVSAHDRHSADAVKAFECGADEYLPKPVDPDLLLARLAALLRRGVGVPLADDRLTLGALAVSPESREVALDGRVLELTNMEFELLCHFLRNPNRVLTRGLILESVWGTVPDMNTRTVDKHVETLRRKLGPYGSKIETVVRVGYMLKVGA